MEHTMITTEEFHTHIKGKEYNHYMYVDVYDEDGVWISMNVPNARANMIITKSQAKDMIASLIRIVNHIEAE
jgi:hypothetical protein